MSTDRFNTGGTQPRKEKKEKSGATTTATTEGRAARSAALSRAQPRWHQRDAGSRAQAAGGRARGERLRHQRGERAFLLSQTRVFERRGAAARASRSGSPTVRRSVRA